MRDHLKIVGLSVLVAAAIALFLLPGLTPNNYQYFLSQRIPKVGAIILTAASIAFSAVLFQTVTANRILTPTALGLDALYLMLQAVVVFAFGSMSLLAVNKNLNFLTTTTAMVLLAILLFRFTLRRESTNIIHLVLVGTVLGQLFRSFASFLLMIIDPNEFVALQNKLFATFNGVNAGILGLAAAIFAVLLVWIYRDLPCYDLIALGRDHAVGLGVDHDRLIRRSLVIISILVSVATALVGPITFLGLLIANIARQTVKTYRHSVILPVAVLLGAVFLLGGQLIVERLLNFDSTVSVIINFVGGTYFIILLVRESKL